MLLDHKLAHAPTFTAAIAQNPIQRLILNVQALVRKLFDDACALLIVCNTFELHAWVYIPSHRPHELHGES